MYFLIPWVQLKWVDGYFAGNISLMRCGLQITNRYLFEVDTSCVVGNYSIVVANTVFYDRIGFGFVYLAMYGD